MEDIKDEENSDSSFILSDFDSESNKEESLQEEQYHIESFGNNWDLILFYLILFYFLLFYYLLLYLYLLYFLFFINIIFN